MYYNNLEIFKNLYKKFNFPTKECLKIEWNVGFILLFLCVGQIVSGFFLTLFFKVGLSECLVSKCFMMKEVYLGWGISYFHLILVNFIFLCLFMHIFKNFYYNTYLFCFCWYSGVLIFFLFIIMSFTGYGLILGSLGFWAMMVVLGMLEYVMGENISVLVFSDFGAISDLISFKIFSYHYFFSLSLILFIFFHFYTIHMTGSSSGDFFFFIGYFEFLILSFYKDLFFFIFFLIFICLFFMNVEFLFSLDNFIELDVFKVPEEINSEWYLSQIFMLLSSVNSKILGILFIFLYFFMIFFKNLNLNLFLENMISSKFYFFYSFIILFILIIFTYTKFGGSFYFTSLFLFVYLFLLDYDLVFIGFINFKSKWNYF